MEYIFFLNSSHHVLHNTKYIFAFRKHLQLFLDNDIEGEVEGRFIKYLMRFKFFFFYDVKHILGGKLCIQYFNIVVCIIPISHTFSLMHVY